MGVNNLYKIIPLPSLKSQWYGKFIVEDENSLRKNLNETKCVIKLRQEFQTENDVPSQFLADFNSLKSWNSHTEITNKLTTAEWQKQTI